MKTITLSCFLFLAVCFANTVVAQWGVAGGNVFLTNNANRVAIGPNSTSHKLEVVRLDGDFKIAKFRNSATTLDRTALIDIENGAGTLWRYGVGGLGNGLGFTAGQFYIERPGAVALTIIPTNGNVGIGVNAPTRKLQVSGNVGIVGSQTGLFFNDGQFFTDGTGANFNISTHANLIPDANCTHDLGSSTLRWNHIYLCNAPVVMAFAQKENAQDLSYGLKEILKLRAVTYTQDQKKIGLIAQEVRKVIPEMVSSSSITTDELTGKITEEKSEQLGLEYDALIPVFINAFKEQQAAIEAKDKQVNDLQAQVEEFKTQLNELKSMLVIQGLLSGKTISNGNSGKAMLQSVAPNPFNTKTTIRYFIPDNAGSVAINIVTANGGVMKTYSGLQKGSGQLVINGSELAAGTYMAVLVVNGLKVSSRQIVLTR